MKLYEIRNSINDKVYVGITRNSLATRYRSHKYSARHDKTPLYRAMRKHGFDKFRIELIEEFESIKDMEDAEFNRIAKHRLDGVLLYNVLDGGASYFPIKDWESHKAVLRMKRKGRKPALGMKHTEENKLLFSIHGKARWDKYGRYPADVTQLPFKESTIKYGISKTHYYRLKKLAGSNDLS